MMRPREALKTCFAKAFTWEGRASRSEFWWCAAPWFLLSSSLLVVVSSHVATGNVKQVVFVFIAANTPVYMAAVRRMTDAGTLERHASYVGWGLAGVSFGPGLYVIWNDVAQRDGPFWMVPVMIATTLAGVIALTYLLSAPSKSLSTCEVSQ